MVQHVIGHREGFGECGFLVRQTKQVLVRDDDQRINNFLQRLDTLFGLTHALVAFKLERLGHNTNGQNTQFTRGLRYDRRSACARTTTHTGGDETHMRTGKVINDLLNALFGSGGSNRGTRTCTQPLGHFHAQLDTIFRFRLLKRLCVRIGDHKLHTIELLVDHVVHSVAASATHTKNGDPWL